AAEPLERSIGNCPTPLKNHFFSFPVNPGDVKYSCFAGNTTLRRRCNGMKKESATARWFPARITPPRFGTCSAPITLVGQKSRSNGPRSTYFISRYTTAIAALLPYWTPAPSLQPRDSTVLLCDAHHRGCTSVEEVSKTNSGAFGDTVRANTLRGATHKARNNHCHSKSVARRIRFPASVRTAAMTRAKMVCRMLTRRAGRR